MVRSSCSTVFQNSEAEPLAEAKKPEPEHKERIVTSCEVLRVLDSLKLASRCKDIDLNEQ